MYAADALQEMLFQMRDGVVEVFPAIPEKWKAEKLSFTHFRGEKGLLVSASYEYGAVQEIVLEATYEQTVTLRIGTVEKEIVLKENEIIKLGNDIV